MPTDSNGAYSLPTGYLVNAGDTIQPSQHNPPLEDLAAAATARLPRSGSAPMTGPLKIADGTVGAPSLAFSSVPTTGFYKTTNGIAVAVGGVNVADFVAGGAIGFIGQLIPYTGTVALALTVLPFGQTLSRTTYAKLWEFAQIEIAAGNTFYNNGNGTTTFGIGDMRGRMSAGWDSMGGSAALRLTTAGSAVDGATIGAFGGSQNKTLLQSDLPNVNVAGAVTDTGHTHGVSGGTIGTTSGNNQQAAPASGNQLMIYGTTINIVSATTGISVATRINGNVTQTLVNGMPPAMVTNYLLFAGA